MSRPEIEQRARELRRQRVPYVHARVVLAEPPTSAKPGDEALILGDGTMLGFVGGSCGESTIRSQSLVLLDSGESTLLRISAVPEPAQPAKVTVVNPCLSGGTFEVFLQPEIPAPVVAVAGESPIARSLVELGTALGYEVRSWDPSHSGEVSALVVASHGRGDEAGALQVALRAKVPYVALVGSRRRGAAVVAGLDVSDEQRGSVRTPAGLDIGARSAGEVALSILAQIVAERPRPSARPPVDRPSVDEPVTAVDPVCGMSVATVPTSLHYDLVGADGGVQRFWFCGEGCLRAFAADPEPYLTS
jgi:xanthine dehydrogenase accessory factor